MQRNRVGIEARGYVSFYCEPSTLGELRQFIELVDKYRLPESTPVEEGAINITIEGEMSPIQCGCAIPDASPVDWYMDALITLHKCEEL